MPVIWNPTGQLDVATDPADLPVQIEGKVAISGAMTRCTNLDLDRQGIASTRRGSVKLNASPLDQTSITRIIEQAGYRFSFAGTKIYLAETMIAENLTSAVWSGVLYNAYNTTTQAVFALNGTDRKRIEGSTVNEWGTAGPTQAANIEIGSLTGLTGAYMARLTYIRKEGAVTVYESDPSPLNETAVTLANQSLKISWPAPTDSQITHVRVYRTLTGGTVYYWDVDHLVSLTTYDSQTADSALGSALDFENHNRPPLGSVVLGPNYGGTLFILKDNLLYFCLPNQPEYWPENYYIEVSPKQYPLKAGAFLDGQLLIASQDEVYAIQGTGAASFFPLPMSAITGTMARECFEAIKGYGLVHLGSDGLYQYTGGKDQKITYAFDPIFWGETMGSIPGMNRTYIANCVLKSFNSKFYFGFPTGSNQYCADFLIWDLKRDRVQHYQYPFQVRTMTVDHYNNRLLAGDTSGYIWELEKYGATGDDVTAISWDVQTGEFSHLRKYFPRYLRYDVQVGAGATATGNLLMDDVSKQSHTITGSRLTKKRLISGCTGDRLSCRINGTGSVDIYGLEVE